MKAEVDLYTITINNQENTGHTYEAYQIFTSTLAEGVLSNIKWGNGVLLKQDRIILVMLLQGCNINKDS